jgi:serine protease Do
MHSTRHGARSLARIGLRALLIFMSSLGLSIRIQSQRPPESNDPLQQLSKSLERLTDRVCPAVVQLQISAYDTDVDDDNDDNNRTPPRTTMVLKQHVVGSGVILDSTGYIVTNAHVLKGAKRIRAVLNPHAGAGSAAKAVLKGAAPTYDATVVGMHEDTDLAVIKIDAVGLPTLELASYDSLRQGQLVVAIGSPLGMPNAVTMGIVSSVARQPDPEHPLVYIQTDAAINPGNSGGALVNTDGHLVGINTLSNDGGTVGFAVPSDTVRFVYEQLRKYGRVRHSDLGVHAQAITPTLAAGLGLPNGWGVIVSDVRPGSPADSAGLRAQDIITAFDGKTIESLPELENNLYLRAPGDRVKIQVLRGQTVIDAELSLEEHIEEPNPDARPTNPDKSLIAEFGIFGVDVDRELAKALPGIRHASGVLVSGKTKLADRLEIELRAGDVIHTLNRRQIRDLNDLRREIKGLKPGDAVVLQVERKRRLLYVAFEMD